MRRYLALALACVLAVFSVSALAMGLGEIRLNSYLNQRLDAEIELVSAAADELESLEVRLADRSAFERYGLDRDAFLNNLQFKVIRRPNGTAYIKVTSTEAVREPFLTFLVEADWSRGRLLREYTVLVDPPTFARDEQPAAQPQAPAVQGAPEQRVEREPATPARQPEAVRQPETAPAAEETTTGDVVSIPPLEADAQPPARAESTYPQQTEESYGPIQRNENLWSIANRVRPDDSISINQMMIALYRANPEAFQGNINRLKQGYILRIPQRSEIAAISRGEAFNEAKRQNDEWQNRGRGAAVEPTAPADESEAELSLVAPEEETAPGVGTGVGAGGEADDLGMAGETEPDASGDDVDEDAVDLGVEEQTDDRLLDLEDESMQAMQDQAPEPQADEQASDTVPPLAADTETESEAGSTADTSTEAALAEEPQASEPAREAVIEPVRRPEPSLVDRLLELALSPLGLGIAAAILVLLLVGFLVFRRRREGAQANAAAAMADWSDAGDEDSDITVVAGRDEDDATVVSGEPSGIGAVFSHDMEHEDTGTTRLEDDAEATQLLADADKTQMLDKAEQDFSETMVGGQQAVTLDENDPLSEADFHMAYGLYDQAAEVVEKAVQRHPTRKDFLAKLAEIHFAANNVDGFLDAAGKLKGIAGPGDSEWDNVAIMGRQIAPNSDMFDESGAPASSVDLDFGVAGEEFGEETVVNPESPEPAASSTDSDTLDFDIALGDNEAGAADDEQEPAVAAQSDSSDLDFDLDIGGLGEAEESDTESEEPAIAETADNDFDFDFDLGTSSEQEDEAAQESAPAAASDDDTETQTEFDKALQELSAFVDTNLPEQDAGDAVESDSELNLDEFSFNDALPGEDESSVDAGTGDDEEDIGEVGTKLDLARAYIDMGDPDGARGILEEVVSDGDEEQQQEARALLEQLA